MGWGEYKKPSPEQEEITTLLRENKELKLALGIVVKQCGGKVILTDREIVDHDGSLVIFKDPNTLEISIQVRPKKESDETTGNGARDTSGNDDNPSG